MRKSTLITVLIVLLVISLSTGVLAARGVNILGLNLAADEGEDENGQIEEGEEGLETLPGENDDDDEDEEPGGARALYPELEGKEFGQAISALAKTYPGAVADAIRVSRGEEPKGPPPHGDDEEDENDDDLELETSSEKGKGKPAFVGKMPHGK